MRKGPGKVNVIGLAQFRAFFELLLEMLQQAWMLNAGNDKVQKALAIESTGHERLVGLSDSASSLRLHQIWLTGRDCAPLEKAWSRIEECEERIMEVG